MLFTFPSRYCSTIGHQRYLALDGGPPGFSRNSSCSGLLGVMPTPEPSVSPTGLSPSPVRSPNTVRLQNSPKAGACGHPQHAPQPHKRNGRSLIHVHGLGSSPFAHHYSGNLCRFLFLRVLRCFTSPGASRLKRVSWLLQDGFPHSGTSGSQAACASPKFFAADHALRRPSVPRHPPYALATLTSLFPHSLCRCQGALLLINKNIGKQTKQTL